MTKDSPTFFKDLDANPQTPKYLLIGCSDSRVGAQEIMGLNQGELFVHRNIANLVVNTDLNVLSVLYYAVNVLKVEDIFVLGHYNCGGVRAASDNKDLGLIDHWLKQIRDVSRTIHGMVYDIKDGKVSERAFWKTRIRATTKLTLFPSIYIRFAHSPPPCSIKNAHNLASLGEAEKARHQF
jgi:carbonic anhydrase